MTIIDKIDNMALTAHAQQQVHLEKFTWKSATMLLIALALLNAALVFGKLMCKHLLRITMQSFLLLFAVFLGLTVSSNFNNILLSSAALYIIVELVLGIIVPLMLIISALVAGSVARMITNNKVHPERLIPGFLTFLSFQSGKNYSYWVIVDTFYFRVKNREAENSSFESRAKLHRHKFTESLATWCIVIVIGITFTLAISYFVSETMVEVDNYRNCKAASRSEEASCFIQPSLRNVNCTENPSMIGNIICYKFLIIGGASDLVQASIQSLFLYIACDKFLTVLFQLVKALLNLRKTMFWALLIMGIGIVLVVMSAVALILTSVVVINFSILQLLQLLIISCDISLAGVLLSISSPLQKVNTVSPNTDVCLAPIMQSVA